MQKSTTDNNQLEHKMPKNPPDPKIVEQAYKLRLLGFSRIDVADQLRISVRTADKYYYSELKKRVPNKPDKEEYIRELDAAQAKRVQQLWDMALDKGTSKRDRLRALQLLQEEDTLNIRKGQLAGILPKEGPLALFQQNNTMIKAEGSKYTFADAFKELYGGNDKKIIEVKKQADPGSEESDE